MLLIYFKDYLLFLPFLLILIILWNAFVKINFFSKRLAPSTSDKLKNSKYLKKTNHKFIVNLFCINILYFILFFKLIKLDFYLFWFNHLKVSNFIVNIFIIILFISLFLFNITKYIKNTNMNFNVDYFFSLSNLIILTPVIFLSNNMYTFLFVLELISLTILYKFSVSRSWFNKNNFLFSRLLPKSYLNMIFFQYWANFFSSMLLMYSIFNIIYIFGSSEWFFLNVCSITNKNHFFFYKNYITQYLWISFLIGVLFKLGFTPLQLFKIEVYKGIPFISIFFYTTFYFLSFFLFFVITIYKNLYNFNHMFNSIIFLFIFTGLFYSISLIFDVSVTKSFFAYSTIVNVTNFFIILLIVLN